MKLVTLTHDECRAVALPGSDSTLRMMLRGLAAPTAEVSLDASDRADLRACLDGMRVVYLDATEHGLRVTPASEEPTAEPQPDGVTVGQCVSARLLCAALDALPRGPVMVVWRRRFDPLTVHAVEGPAGLRDAVVMPRRSCTLMSGTSLPAPGCACRDCCAGHAWGWR